MVNLQDAIEGMLLDDIAAVLTPNVVWVGLYPGELCRNRDDVLEMFERLRYREDQLRPTVVAKRDDILVVDAGIDERHHVLVLEGDLISEVRVYPDRSSAMAAVDERPPW
ncbi:MAG TPA: hypothetical protein VF124_05875 [Gaiellaceae bacterium]